jgi:MPBQ/MSBQ methyltransferase
MNGNLSALVRPVEYDTNKLAERSFTERVIDFYEEAVRDYEHWSRGFNMHLGFYRRGMNPFDREGMLEQLNLEVARRLRLSSGDPSFLIDLGCGVGAIARSVARNYPDAIVKGITITPSQVEIAAKLNVDEDLQNRIEVIKGNYTALPFDEGTADGVWAVESACYAEGAAKEDLIVEMARVLKTGGRFVVADCFVMHPEKKFNTFVGKCYSAACRNWELSEMPTLDHVVKALERHGFQDVVVEDISWRTAPSLAHAPFAVLTFIIKKILAGERLKQASINNLKASLLALALGSSRSKFSYCLISGTRA